jgi:hypothetical protein
MIHTKKMDARVEPAHDDSLQSENAPGAAAWPLKGNVLSATAFWIYSTHHVCATIRLHGRRFMSKIASTLFLSFLFALCLHVAAAHAQYVRTCVSMATGNDANTCHCTQPCRSFQRAHSQTLDLGEITVLDPGDYGGLTITKSISINNDSGGEASISVSGGTTGIIVNAGSSAFVNLRGITIQGVGFGGGNGLQFNAGLSLTMENCVIRNHTGVGIDFAPNANSNLSVADTLVADNGGIGIRVQPSGSGTVRVALHRVAAYNNSSSGINVTGTFSTGTIAATVADSIAANNGASGFVVSSFAGSATTSLLVVRSLAAGNATGLTAGGNVLATLRVGQSTVTGNATSWAATSGAILRSYGDNNIDGNGDSNPAPTTIVKK